MSETPLFEQISAYLDGALSPAEKEALEDHLRQDPKARDLYRQLAEISKGFDHLVEQGTPSLALTVDGIIQEAQRQTYLQALLGGLSALAFVSMVAVPIWFHVAFATPSSATTLAGVATEVSLSLQPESLELP
jgi:anti-sigma factor RsiW